MHISETTVRRPVLATVISMFLVLIGLVSYDKLTIREYPDIDKPVVTVTTIYRGASAEIVERDITQILEDSLAGISNIKEIKSESRDELSSIRIEFTLSRDMESAANDVREKVARASPLLPKDSDQPRVAKSDTDARAILWIGFTSEQLDSIELNDYLDRNIVKVFLDENQNAYDFKRDIYDAEIGGVFRHIGFYGFQKDILFEITSLMYRKVTIPMRKTTIAPSKKFPD